MHSLKTFLESKGQTFEQFNELEAEKQAELYNEMNEANSAEFKALKEDANTTKEMVAKMGEEHRGS